MDYGGAAGGTDVHGVPILALEGHDVVADNPGVWMFRHNLPHAADGLVTHVGYEGATTPFRMGSDSGNEPE